MKALLEFLHDHGIRYVADGSHQHARTGWIQFDCPFCGPRSGKYHMGFRLDGGYVNCWKCGRHDLAETLQVLSGQDFSGVREDLSRIRSQTSRVRDEPVGGLRSRTTTLPRDWGRLGRPHREYLRSRGFHPRSLVKLWSLYGVGITSPLRMSWRIGIPIYQDGRLVSWTSRSIGDTGLRYVTASAEEESVDHRTILFGEDYCRHTVIVTEGPFDAMRIGPGAVATLGTSISMAQVGRLSRYPVRVVCLDNEPTAQKRARQIVNLLSVFAGETYHVVLDAKDPGSAPMREIHKLREEFLDG